LPVCFCLERLFAVFAVGIGVGVAGVGVVGVRVVGILGVFAVFVFLHGSLPPNISSRSVISQR